MALRDDDAVHSFFSLVSVDISNKSGMCTVCWRSRRNGTFSSSTAALVVTHTANSINVFENFIMFNRKMLNNTWYLWTKCCSVLQQVYATYMERIDFDEMNFPP